MTVQFSLKKFDSVAKFPLPGVFNIFFNGKGSIFGLRKNIFCAIFVMRMKMCLKYAGYVKLSIMTPWHHLYYIKKTNKNN